MYVLLPSVHSRFQGSAFVEDSKRKPVMYGMLILLEHRRTGKLIVSEESGGSGLRLDKQLSKRAYFRIVSWGKKTMDGEKVWGHVGCVSSCGAVVPLKLFYVWDEAKFICYLPLENPLWLPTLFLRIATGGVICKITCCSSLF